MIAVDTSALMAIVLGEPQGEACMIAIKEVDGLLISGTVAKALIVAARVNAFAPLAIGIGDCFAYEVAVEHDCPLLYVGDDFLQTDVRSAL